MTPEPVFRTSEAERDERFETVRGALYTSPDDIQEPLEALASIEAELADRKRSGQSWDAGYDAGYGDAFKRVESYAARADAKYAEVEALRHDRDEARGVLRAIENLSPPLATTLAEYEAETKRLARAFLQRTAPN